MFVRNVREAAGFTPMDHGIRSRFGTFAKSTPAYLNVQEADMMSDNLNRWNISVGSKAKPQAKTLSRNHDYDWQTVFTLIDPFDSHPLRWRFCGNGG